MKEENNKEVELPKLEESKSIGKIKKDRQKSPFTMLFLFGVLIAAIFFIPEITPYFSELLSKLNISSNDAVYETNTTNTTSTNDDSKEEVIESSIVSITSTTTYDSLEFSNFKLSVVDGVNTLTYSVTNKKNSTYDFLTNKIYIDFYDENKTYLGRILVNTSSLKSSSSIELNTTISESIYNKVKYIEVVKRDSEDYPEITLTNNTLTCSNTNRTLTYSFKESKLTKITDNFTYTKTLEEEKFVSDSIEAQSKIKKLNELEGVSAFYVATSNGFTTSVEIDYSKAEENLQSTENFYYPKDTLAKVVKYEMESIGYTCN